MRLSAVLPTGNRLQNGAWLSLARALGSGPRGRQFKSVRPDQFARIFKSSKLSRAVIVSICCEGGFPSVFMKKQVHAYYTGRVQGVGFRFTAEDIARGLGVCGWVKNLGDGRVEVIAEAEEGVLKDFLAKINQYFSRYIQDADIEWKQESGRFKDFGIEF